MSSSSATIEGSRPHRKTLTTLALAFIFAGWVSETHAQVEIKKAIVKIVTSGTRIDNDPRVVDDTYVGSGFIVHSAESRGEAETVIVTADHVLGYSLQKAKDPDSITFKEGEIENPPPVWVNRGHEGCRADLRVPGDKFEASQPCRQIKIFHIDEGRWVPYNAEVQIQWQGDKNRDAAVLLLKYFEKDQRRLEIGSGFSLNEAGDRERSLPLPPFTAWGVASSRPESDPFANNLTYRWRNDGPTLIFQNAVEPGNSGGPVMFEGKVVGIISGVQSGETRATNISTVYDALRLFDIPAIQQVDRVPAVQLLRQIRCEARHSIMAILVQWFASLGRQGDPVISALAAAYQADPEQLSAFDTRLLQGEKYTLLREALGMFYATGIAYAFESYPRFISTDSFGVLIKSLGQPGPEGMRYCDGVIAKSGSGRSGIDGLVRDFFQLSIFGNLGGQGNSTPPTMVDILKYTSAPGRSDVHIVTVALAIPSKNNEPNGTRATVFVGNRLTGRSNTQSEMLALLAIDQARNRPLP